MIFIFPNWDTELIKVKKLDIIILSFWKHGSSNCKEKLDCGNDIRDFNEKITN